MSYARRFCGFLFAALCGLMLTMQGCSASEPFASRPQVAQFIQEMVKDHGFNQAQLTTVMNQVVINPKVIALMTKPYEAKPWYQYQTFFVNPWRIEHGVAFWQEHAKFLQETEQKYGVPASIIVAILGVETRYGTNTGGFKVIDALSTLAFDYPPRAAFFRKELVQYLLLCRDKHFDPLTLKGSYAGAMGYPQFMPSSYRHYAVDAAGQPGGRSDLLTNTKDVIASVANYLKQNGWQANGVIAEPAQGNPQALAKLPSDKKKLELTVAELTQQGLVLPKAVSPSQKAAIIALQEAENQAQYWVAFHNFYVIMRYNTSKLYAMAVYQLAEKIAEARAQELAKLKQEQKA